MRSPIHIRCTDHRIFQPGHSTQRPQLIGALWAARVRCCIMLPQLLESGLSPCLFEAHFQSHFV